MLRGLIIETAVIGVHCLIDLSQRFLAQGRRLPILRHFRGRWFIFRKSRQWESDLKKQNNPS